MLVYFRDSGYLYHKACKEPYWTDVPMNSKSQMLMFHLPEDFPLLSQDIPVSYCKWLQTTTEKEGLTMELLRSLTERRGLGQMLKDKLILDAAGDSTRVFYSCMSLQDSQLPTLREFVKPWGRGGGDVSNIEIAESSSHHTDLNEQRRLVSLATATVLEQIPLELLVTFPCPSQFYSTVAAKSSFLHDLRVMDYNLTLPSMPQS